MNVIANNMIKPSVWRAMSRVVLLALAALFASTSCASKDDSLLDRHLRTDGRAKSKERWNAMRGSMKLQIVEQHLRAGRLAEAQSALNDVFAIVPEHPEALKLAVQIYLEQGRLASAREAVQKALAQPGRDAGVEHLAGVIADRYEERENALRHYMRAAELAPGTLEYLLCAAETLVALDRPGEALELIAPRRGDLDDAPELALLAARIYQSMHLRKPAADECRRALRGADEDTALALEAGEILLWAGVDDEAVAVLRPVFDRWCQERGRRGDRDRGIDFPISLATQFASAYLRMGMAASAMDVLRPVMTAAPQDAAVWTLFCRAAIAGDDLASAHEAMETFHRHAPATAETLLLCALVAQRRGEFAEACRYSADALQRDQALVSAWWIMGQSARSLGRYEEAKEALAHALALEPDCRQTRAMLETVLDEIEAGGS